VSILLALNTYRLINEVFLLGDDIDRQLFAQFNLTVRQYHLLNWLDRRGACSLTELAQLLLCDKSNVTGLVRRLTSARLIEKIPSADRRFTRVQLTGAGKKIHDEAQAALLASIEARFPRVSESEHAELQALLTLIHRRLDIHLDHLNKQPPAERGRDGKGVMPLQGA
jgi:DNA-binding MarR family transcriptional regulator